MREGRANGGIDEEGGGGATAEGIRRRPRQPRDASSSPQSSSCAAALASCGRREDEEGEENQGGGKKHGRRKSKRREAVARAIRDRLPAAPSCWGNVSMVQGVGGRRGRNRRERPDDDDGAVAGEDDPAGATGRAPAAAWCCVCPGGNCELQPNPSANGKEDAGLRSLIERNDFYSGDCNPHADAFPAGAHLIE